MSTGHTVQQALPVVAASYARKFGVTVRMTGMKAFTNGSVITIPRLDLSDPHVVRVAYGYLAHEAAHVRHTNFRVLALHRNSFLMKTLVNILEDSRVERIVGREFIGVWENLELLRNDHESWDQFVNALTTMPDLQLLLGGLIAYLASYIQQFKRQRPRAALVLRELRRRCPDLKRRLMLRKIFRWALQVHKATNTRAVCELAECLLADIDKLFDTTHEMQAPDDEQDYEPGQELIKAEEDMARACNNDAASVIPGAGFASRINGMVNLDSASRDDFGCMLVNPARPGLPDFGRFLDKGTARRMVRMLRQKILAFVNSARDSVADHGRYLDIPRAQFVRCGESRIFRPRAYERDPSTDVTVLIDCSGSMLGRDGNRNSGETRARLAALAALILSAAFDGIPEVRVQVLAFPGEAGELDLVKDFTQDTMRRAAYFDQQPRGSTPLAQALYMAAGRLTSVDRHVILVLTDGIPDSISLATQAINQLEDSGYDVMAIGMATDFAQKLFKNSVSIDVQKLSTLPEVMVGLLSDYFARRARELDTAA